MHADAQRGVKLNYAGYEVTKRRGSSDGREGPVRCAAWHLGARAEVDARG